MMLISSLSERRSADQLPIKVVHFIISSFVEKEKKLFNTTRKKWEELSEACRMRYSLVGYYRQEECDQMVDSIFHPSTDSTDSTDSTETSSSNQPNETNPTSSPCIPSYNANELVERVCNKGLCFSSYIKEEMKKEKEKYTKLSFIQQYNLLRSKWNQLSAEEKSAFMPTKQDE